MNSILHLLQSIGKLAIRVKLYIKDASTSNDIEATTDNITSKTYGEQESVNQNDLKFVAVGGWDSSDSKTKVLQVDETHGLSVGKRQFDDTQVTLHTYAQVTSAGGSNAIDTSDARSTAIRLHVGAASTPNKVRIEGSLSSSGTSWGTIKYFNNGNNVQPTTDYMEIIQNPPHRLRIYWEDSGGLDMYLSAEAKNYF